MRQHLHNRAVDLATCEYAEVRNDQADRLSFVSSKEFLMIRRYWPKTSGQYRIGSIYD